MDGKGFGIGFMFRSLFHVLEGTETGNDIFVIKSFPNGQVRLQYGILSVIIRKLYV